MANRGIRITSDSNRRRSPFALVQILKHGMLPEAPAGKRPQKGDLGPPTCGTGFLPVGAWGALAGSLGLELGLRRMVPIRSMRAQSGRSRNGGYGSVPAEALVVDLGDGPKFVRRGRAKAEELEICRNSFEQHVGADLNFTATRPCGRQKWRDFLFHHDLAHER